MFDRIIPVLLENFSIIMFALAVVVAAVISVAARRRFSEQLFRWTALLAAGLVGIYTAVGHVFFPERTAAEIGWHTSPFQFEVGMADLAIGVLGVLAFRASAGFRTAATIAVTIWLGGDAVGHVRQMLIAGNFAPGNAGPWFWSDVLVPLVMIASLVGVRRHGNVEDRGPWLASTRSKLGVRG